MHMPAIAIFPLALTPFTEITHTYSFKNVTSVIGKKSAVMEIQKALYLLKHDQREG